MLNTMIYIVLLLQLCMTQSFAKQTLLDITPKEEISILKSLDIDPTFRTDYRYIQLKQNINALKKLYFIRTLKRGNLFMPNLQELLGKSDIPNTFLYMAMVESKFLADSKSHKHAAGLWQFMPATAKKYKLTNNRHIDERLDPIKSTKAAIEYLQYLHHRFHKWYLAAMAYNCGESRLYRALVKAQTDNLAVLLDEDEDYIPKETRDYLQRILVAALLAHDKNIIKKNNSNHLFGFCSSKKLVKLFFRGGESLSSISVQIGVPVQKLKDCNPQLIGDKLPPSKKMFYVYLPEDVVAKVKERIKNTKDTFTYHVRPNDTLFLISKRFNIKMQAIKMLNPQLKKVLKIGQPLTLLGKDPFEKEHNTTKPTVIKNQTFIYTVEKNMSLYEISLKFNNKLKTLQKLNPTLPKKLTKGMKVTVIRDINLSKIPEQNLSKTPQNFKTKPISGEGNKSFEDNKSYKIKTDQNKTDKVLPSKHINEKNNSIKVQNIVSYHTIVHTIKPNQTFEDIAKQYNLKIKDILKAGNVIIMKIKQEHKIIHENNKTNSNTTISPYKK